MTGARTVTFFLALIASALSQANFQLQYNGGSRGQNLQNNPYLLNNLLSTFGGQPQTYGACAQIQGVGLPILAVKKILQDIDTNLDSADQNSFAKIIYFTEKVSAQGLYVTVVLKFYTFTKKFFVGVSGLLKAKGLPRFQLTNYHYDTDINAVAASLQTDPLDENAFITCGEVKTIYTNYVRSMRTDTSKLFNIPAGKQMYGGMDIPTSLGQPNTFYQNDIAVGATRFRPQY